MVVTGIGEELRRERVRQGLTLDDVVVRTRVSLRSLEAIESDAFDRLPGTVFARNFVRLYAADLALDPEPLLARLPVVDIASQPLPNPPSGSGRAKWDPRLTAVFSSVLWLATAGAAVTGAWYYFNHYSLHLTRTIAAAAAPVQKAAQASAPSASGNSPIAESAPAERQQPVTTQSQLPEGFDGSRPVQVILTAREAAWVQVSADGHNAFVGLLKPHDSRVIAANDQVKVITGNAGGLDISLNGKPLDPIGPSGQVRTVRLTAEGPQLVERTQPASSPL